MVSPAAVMVCGYWGRCVPVWVLALFRIKRLIKEAIETPSSPIAAVQETGQLVSIYCPTRLFKIPFQDNLEPPPGLIMCSLASGKLLSRFAALGTITGRTFCSFHKISFNDTILRLQGLRCDNQGAGKGLSEYNLWPCWGASSTMVQCSRDIDLNPACGWFVLLSFPGSSLKPLCWFYVQGLCEDICSADLTVF